MKPVQEEHSKARAEDRGQPIGFEWLEDTRERLGDPVVVEGLIRGMLLNVSRIRTDYNADKIEGEKAASMIEGEAERVANIFQGKDKAYAAMMWNTPEILGARLVEAGFGEDPATSVQAALLSSVSRLIDEMMEHEKGELEDEDISFRVEVIIDDTMEYMLGASLEKLIPQELAEDD